MSSEDAFSAHESYYVCSEARSWRRVGLSESEMQKEKNALLTDFDLDPENRSHTTMLNAAIAHNRIRAWNLIDASRRKMLRDEWAQWMYKEVEGIGGEERIALQQMIAEQLGFSIEQVQAITDGLPPPQPDDYFQSDGTHTDYTNEQKRGYHDALHKFLTEHSTEEEREHFRVLCMSGIECVEPKNVYVPAGVQPENIVCCESAKERLDRARFLRNCRREGFIPVNQPMEKYMEENDVPFDVLSIDPTGQMSYAVEEMIMRYRFTARGMVFLNIRAQRESGRSQANIEAFSLNEEWDKYPGFEKACVGEYLISRRRKHEKVRVDTSQRDNLRDLRFESFVNQICCFASLTPQELDGVQNVIRAIGEDGVNCVHDALSNISDAMMHFLRRNGVWMVEPKKKAFSDEGFQVLQNLILSIGYLKTGQAGVNEVVARGHHEYVSRSWNGKGASYFMTTMVALRCRENVMRILKLRIAEFIFKAVLAMVEENEVQMVGRNKDVCVLSDGAKAASIRLAFDPSLREGEGAKKKSLRNKKLCAFVNGKIAATIKYKQLRKDLETACCLLSSNE